MTGSRSLTVVQQAPDEGACCAACAAAPAVAASPATAPAATRATGPSRPPDVVPAPPPAPVREALPVAPAATRGRPAIARGLDRRITFAGLATAVLLLAAAVASLLLPPVARRGLWLPLHLGLAGAAGTAVAAVLPFFTAALAVARPAHPGLRVAAIALTAGGAAAVSMGVVVNGAVLAVTGGIAYLAGLAALAATAFLPLRGALGPRRRLVERAYAGAIAQVCVGAALATAMLAGATPIVAHWAQLKPAHAWLNVLGFLTVIVAATLIHLGPTVAGTRIRPRRSAVVAVAGLAAGPALVAAGFALAADPVARVGAIAAFAGAVGLVGHAVGVVRDRGRWTSDVGWHRFTIGSLTAAPAWLLVAIALAAGPVLALGAVPAAWPIDDLAAPLGIGWLGQVLVGSWSHLLPAIGPGDMPVHARQRQVLGRAGIVRLLALNAGVGAMVAGSALAADALVLIGGLAAIGALIAGLALFAGAALAGRPGGRPARPPAVP